MTGQSGGGPLRLSGTLNQLSSVTLNGSATSSTPSTNFTGLVPMTVGTNVVAVVAQDQSGLATTNRYQIVIPPTGLSAYRQYDGNGNLISDGTRTYEWDAANLLTAINYGSIRSEFTYDGLSRRIEIVEKNSGSITATRQFVWVGSNPAEERDASDTVQKGFFQKESSLGRLITTLPEITWVRFVRC